MDLIDRPPPQSPESERALISTILTNPEAMTLLAGTISATDFYNERHRKIFSVCESIFISGRSIDPMTVGNELRQQKELESIGGIEYLSQMIQMSAPLETCVQYATQVRDTAKLRAAITAMMESVSEAYSGVESVSDFIARTEGKLLTIGQDHEIKKTKSVGDLAAEQYDDMNHRKQTGAGSQGILTGLDALDSILHGFKPAELTIIAGRPGQGKTSAGFCITRNVAYQGFKILFCSLEMGESPIMNRAYCLETGIDFTRIQEVKYLTHQDWIDIRAAKDRLKSIPLWVNDKAKMSLMDVMAECRRLKQGPGLDLVMVDYLQLMAPMDKKIPREQQISSISAGLKGMAKDLKIPVVALAQLSRACEARPGPDKRPQLSDLRECVIGDTLVTCADGHLRPIRELEGQAPVIRAITRDNITVDALSDKVWKVGVKPVFNLVTTSGRRISATSGHRFKTFGGWVTLDKLNAGDRIAVVRNVPEPKQLKKWPDELVALLGQMIGDGSYIKGHRMSYTSSCPHNADAVRKGVLLLGSTMEVDCCVNGCFNYSIAGNGDRWHHSGVNAWLRSLGIFDQICYEKHIPEDVFSFSNNQLALFLRHLWATDGTFCVGKSGTAAIAYTSTSRRLIEQVIHLLLRFGIIGRFAIMHKSGYRDTYGVQISGGADQLKFCQKIGAFGRRVDPMQKVMAALAQKTTNTNVDTLPKEVWDIVRSEMRMKGITQRKMAELRGTSYGGTAHFKFAPSRETIKSYAEILQSEQLDRIAVDDDVFWDSVKSIEPVGEQDVYDLTVPGLENWQANGIVTHNSGAIEQDADVVIFLYRPEYYLKDKVEEKDRGLMEMIVAKHRNGSTGTAEQNFDGPTMNVTDRKPPSGY